LLVFNSYTTNITQIQPSRPAGVAALKTATFKYTSCYNTIRTDILNWRSNAGLETAGFSGGDWPKSLCLGVSCGKRRMWWTDAMVGKIRETVMLTGMRARRVMMRSNGDK
jgi:hypothetical protein